MDAGLRRAWTEIVTPEDYEAHMLAVGQAQAAAELTRHVISTAAPAPGARIVFAGAGTGQMLDWLDPDMLRPYRLTFSDLNPVFLARLQQRLARHGLDGETIEDDIEKTRLEPGADLLLSTLLLEHVDWRRGAQSFARLRPANCGVILQENPPGMQSAVTPGRVLPASVARAVEIGHPTLVPRNELIAVFQAYGYSLCQSEERDVADSKRLVALRFAILQSAPGGTPSAPPRLWT